MDAYHQARMSLFDELFRDAHLPPQGNILDAGAGDGFYSQLLADRLGRSACLVAADHNGALLRALDGPLPNVSRLLSDLDRLPLAPGSLDAIWHCRSMHSADNPVGLLAGLVPLLRPGGRLVVIENNTAHSPILPLPPDFERRLREARYVYEHTVCRAECRPERYSAGPFLTRWLAEAGLVDIWAHTYTTEDFGPLPASVAAYWQQFLDWEGTRIWPYLSPEDQAVYNRLLRADSPDYLLARRDVYCLELTTMAIASRSN
ncbi:MAG: methyltransferase domain-containing protein [Anaerolineales bacterium]